MGTLYPEGQRCQIPNNSYSPSYSYDHYPQFALCFISFGHLCSATLRFEKHVCLLSTFTESEASFIKRERCILFHKQCFLLQML